MTRTLSCSLLTAMPIALLSQSAFADITPSEVWTDWRGYMQGMGYTINSTETQNGADLTISDLIINMVMPDEGGAVSMSLGTLTFAQNPDGSVAIVMPAVLPLVIDIAPEGEDAKPVKMTMDYTQSGHSMTASGTADKMTYAYDAQALGLVLSQLQVGDETFGEQNAKFNLAATGVDIATTMTAGDLRQYQQTGKIASVTYDVLINNPEDPTVVKLSGNVADIAVTGGGAIPIALAGAGDMAAMLNAGFDVNGKITFGAGTSLLDVNDPENGVFSMNAASTGGDLSVDMASDALAYSGSRKDLAVNVEAADLPFPIALSMAEGAFNLMMPISKADTAQDFAFGVTLDKFTMSDMIWGIFDPTAQLPRDPATVILDLTGKAKLLVDFLNPEAAAKMAETKPGEVEALSVNKLVVRAVGAELTGQGDMAFDNTDMQTFPGMPKPVGAVDLKLVGGNGLLDKLVTMGILPQEQAMGARMMMGMFAVPGTDPDTLNSKIEFTQDGQVLANGQRIK